jgi:putative DNA primase/helicase
MDKLNVGQYITEHQGQYTKEKDGFINGFFMGGNFKKKTKDEEILVEISKRPFFIESKIINSITNDVRIKIVYFNNSIKKDFICDYKELTNSKSICNIFGSKGFPINAINYKDFMTYIQYFWNENYYQIPTINATNNMGWNELNNDLEFIPYSNNIQLDLNDDMKQEIKGFGTKGNKNDWIKKVIEYRKNVHFRFMMAISYASPILHLVKARSAVFHNCELSRCGKTTAGFFATSIWGNPELNMLTYTSSHFAIQRKLALRNNITSLIDEFTGLDTNQLSKLIYMIANGKSDSKGTKEGGLRQEYNWNCYVISTAEVNLIKDSQNEGIYNRVVEGSWKPFDNPDIEASEARTFLSNNYGHTGKEFIEELTKIDVNELINILESIEKQLSNKRNLPEHIKIISIVCLSDYITKVFYGGSLEESINIGINILDGLISINEADTSLKALNYLRNWIITNSHNFITGNSDKINTPIGIIEDGEYIIFPEVLNDELERKGWNSKKVLKYIKEKDYAYLDINNKFRQKRINGKNIRPIQFKTTFWEEVETIESKKNQIKLYKDMIKRLEKEIETLDTNQVKTNVIEMNKNNKVSLTVGNKGNSSSTIKKEFDLDTNNINDVLGHIFMDGDYKIYIPDFTNNEVYSQCLNNLGKEFIEGNDFFKCHENYKNVKIGDIKKDTCMVSSSASNFEQSTKK